MKHYRLSVASLLCVMLVTALQPAIVFAHHSHATLNEKDVRLFQGIVTKYMWRSPHVYIQAKAADDKGNIVEYTIEALNPPALEALGWSKTTFKAGDTIVWQGAHDYDLKRAYTGIDWAETSDGTHLLAGATDYREAQRAQDAALAKQHVDPVKEIGSGSWTRISSTGGMFPPIRHPSKDWPLTPAAAENTAKWSEDDNPINECVFGGPPRNIVSLSHFQWSRPDKDTIIIDRDMWTEQRVIHLNADDPKGPPSSYGHSIGHFDGDKLIVETDDFLPEKWGMYTGIDSSAEKKLVERYWLSEGGMRLNVEVTVTDPEVLTKPYTFTHQWKRVPDRPLVKAPCSIESAWFYKTADYGTADLPADAKVALAKEEAKDAGTNAAKPPVPAKDNAPAAVKESTGGLPVIPLVIIVLVVVGLIGWTMRRRK